MFATFHCIAKRASTIRRIHPAGTALLAGPRCPTLTDCGSFKRPLSGPFDGLTRSGLGRIEPLSLAWSCDRLQRIPADHSRIVVAQRSESNLPGVTDKFHDNNRNEQHPYSVCGVHWVVTFRLWLLAEAAEDARRLDSIYSR